MRRRSLDTRRRVFPRPQGPTVGSTAAWMQGSQVELRRLGRNAIDMFRRDLGMRRCGSYDETVALGRRRTRKEEINEEISGTKGFPISVRRTVFYR
jgi:hypothetical protein